MNRRHGFSLVELLVVIVVLGLISAAASLAVRTEVTSEDGPQRILLVARQSAVRTGKQVVGYHDSVGAFVAHPHGMIVTDSAPHLRFTAAAHAK